MISHGEVRPWLAILVAKLVDMKELVALAALFENRDPTWGEVKRFKAWFQPLLLCICVHIKESRDG